MDQNDLNLFKKRQQELRELSQNPVATPVVERPRRRMPPQQPEAIVDQPTPVSQEVASKDVADTTENMGKLSFVYAGVSVLLALVLSYFAFSYLNLNAKDIENTARFECATSSRYQIVKDGTTIWYPSQDLYEQCLEGKGVNN